MFYYFTRNIIDSAYELTGFIFFILLLLIFCIFELVFSVSLCVVDGINDSDVEEMEKYLPDKKKKRIREFKDNADKFENRFHAGLIIVNIFMLAPIAFILANVVNFVKLNFIAKGFELFMYVNEWYFLVALCVLIFYFICFFNYLICFSIPRKIIVHSGYGLKAKLCITASYFSRIAIPFADWSEDLSVVFFKMIGKQKYNENEDVTEDDILSMVQESHDQGILESNEAEMINNIFELNDKEAKDIMTGRSNIIAIDADVSISEAIDIMLSNSNSRYPVYEDNLDHIIGILNLKDAVRFKNNNKNRNGSLKKYPELLREARFIPETRKIDDLFSEMQSNKLQMVLIIDEYGQTSGLVALEDILEEIVGNIMDEFDTDEENIEEKKKDVYEIDGLTTLDELEEELGITFDNESFETLNGFMTDMLGHIPSDDEEFSFVYKSYEFKILSASSKVIQSVLVSKIQEETTENVERIEEK